MDFGAIHSRLKDKFGGAAGEPVVDAPDKPAFTKYCFVEPKRLVEICSFLRDDPELRFEHLNAVAGVDMKDSIHVAYIMTSYKLKTQFVLKVKLDRDNPAVNSVEGVWKAANWHERETFDLLGVRFSGHPDMRRLLLPEDWVGYPLRKDYAEQPDYHGMPTKRPPALGKY